MDPSVYNRENVTKNVSETFKINIEITSAGQYKVSDSADILDVNHLPDRVEKITFESITPYKQRWNLFPQHNFRVVLDFGAHSVIDLSSNPTEPTANGSIISLVGASDTWVEGAFQKLKNISEDKTSYRGWIHRKNVYDLLLWLVCIPVILINLYKLDRVIRMLDNPPAEGFLAVAYIVGLLFSLVMFKLLFNYIRWIFPYLQLAERKHRGPAFHRWAWGAVLSFFFVSAVSNLMTNLYQSVFKLLGIVSS